MNIRPSIATALLLLAVPSFAQSNAGYAPYLGSYKVVKVTRYRGGLTSEEQANHWVGQRAYLDPDVFSVAAVRVEHPTYKLKKIKIFHGEGEIMPNDTSLFYGVAPERNDVTEIQVFRRVNNRLESEPYSMVEIIGPRQLVKMYDGWLVFLEKEPGNEGQQRP